MRAATQTPAIIGRPFKGVLPKNPKPRRVNMAAMVGPARETEEKKTKHSPIKATREALRRAPPIPITVKSWIRREEDLCMVMKSAILFLTPSTKKLAMRIASNMQSSAI